MYLYVMMNLHGLKYSLDDALKLVNYYEVEIMCFSLPNTNKFRAAIKLSVLKELLLVSFSSEGIPNGKSW